MITADSWPTTGRCPQLSAGPSPPRLHPRCGAQLVRVEKQMAKDRSPGALAAVLTGGRAIPARHRDLTPKP